MPSVIRSRCRSRLAFLLAALVCIAAGGCSSTKHLSESQALLRRTTVSLGTDPTFGKKSELSEALAGAIVQTPNDYLAGIFPLKLYLYNARYARYQRDTTNYQLRSGIAQPPVIYDSTAQRRAAQNMRGILYGYGLFYGTVQDTVVVDGKKASVTYRINTGPAYAVDSVVLDIPADTIRAIVQRSMDATLFEKGSAFQMTMLDLERRRISEIVRDAGYYKFTPENITFRLDTLNNPPLTASPNILQTALAAIRRRIANEKPSIDIRLSIRAEGDSTTLHRFYIASTTVFPDYLSSRDFADSSLLEMPVGDVRFRYHRYWLREGVMGRKVFLTPGRYFSQSRYDRTVTQLGELGVFQSVRVSLYDDDTARADPDWHPLRCVVLLTPAARYDFNTNFEVSSGSTYAVGSAVSVGLRNRNVGHGANALNLTLSAGVETALPDSSASLGDLFLRSRNLGANAAVEFPKFIAPVSASIFKRALPRTVVSAGANLLARQDFFTLINYTANFSYNWRQSSTRVWDFTPAFATVQRLANQSDSFRKLSAEVPFIANSYRSTFIQGENLTFTFSNSDARGKFGYSYLRLGVEEAGIILSGVRKIVDLASESARFEYEQYGKIDFDARHYFTRRRSTTAVRISGGIGLPYGRSQHLPYIKQYFVGGANSIRGWRVRTLGPGSAIDTAQQTDFIDRTGDIKLEANAEYRFDIAQFFAGAVRVAGATFVDAGNIWLATKEDDLSLRGGEFRFSKLASDIAMSSGVGVRFDFGGFITLRLDIGIPIKVPYDRNRDGAVDGFVFDEIDFGNPAWRTQNLIPQIGIGYPF